MARFGQVRWGKAVAERRGVVGYCLVRSGMAVIARLGEVRSGKAVYGTAGKEILTIKY